MRAARRSHFVSAAQVAYHFGAYTLKEALALSRTERQLLLNTVLADEERQWDRFERSMGIAWDVADVIAFSQKGSGTPAEIPPVVRIPALLAMAPEFFKAISDDMRKRWSAQNASVVSGDVAPGSKVVEVGSLSAKDARELFKLLERQQPPAPEKT